MIAGLARGVVVVEAARRSGSLSTAARACEYNREVYAVPGRVDSEFSAGTNALIRDQHAKLVTCVDDILDELGEAGEVLRKPVDGTAGEGPPARLNLSDDERRVHGVLDHEERSIETIAVETGQSASKVASTLITLQLKGLAKQLPGNRFVRTGRR